MTMMMLGVVPELETLRLLVLAAVLAEDCWRARITIAN